MELDKLKSGDVVAKELFLVVTASLLKDKRGQDYYDLTLGHKKAKTIQAKVWSSNISDPIKAGDLLEVYGRVDEKFGRQIDVQQYVYKDPSAVDLGEYIRKTALDEGKAFDEIFNWSDGRSQNAELAAVVQYFHESDRFAAEFKTSPAAMTHHHNYQGGLVEHTLEVYKQAAFMADFYGERVNKDLLLAAAALHDIGKTKCYELTVGVSKKTDTGSLLDHVFISASMVSNVWDMLAKARQEEGKGVFDPAFKPLLLHAILAHHGRVEWGSPIVPQIPEALLLFICDHTSAMMRTTFDALDGVKPGENWTDFVYLMDARRKFFVPAKPEE